MQAFFPLLLPLVHGCTYFEVPQKDVGLVIGRSMELGDVLEDMDWRVVVRPRGTPVIYDGAPVGSKQKWGFVTIDGAGFKFLPREGLPLVTEGMNEKGLSVSANTFRGSVYQETPPAGNPSVSWFEVVPFLLSNFANVTEALEGLRATAVVGPPLHTADRVCSTGACFHWAISDASGHSAIVEYIKGKLVVWEGPKQHVGVMTNDPSLDWQMTNLNQYVHVTPDWPNTNSAIEKQLDSGTVPQVVGNGFNLRGLPGDVTPASRFVRAFYLREYAMANLAEDGSSPDGAIKLVTGILNSVYLVKGTVAKNSGLMDSWEYTPWATIKIPKSHVFMYRTAADMTWKQISLNHLDFSVQAQEVISPISQTDLGIKDITKELAPKPAQLIV